MPSLRQGWGKWASQWWRGRRAGDHPAAAAGALSEARPNVPGGRGEPHAHCRVGDPVVCHTSKCLRVYDAVCLQALWDFLMMPERGHTTAPLFCECGAPMSRTPATSCKIVSKTASLHQDMDQTFRQPLRCRPPGQPTAGGTTQHGTQRRLRLRHGGGPARGRDDEQPGGAIRRRDHGLHACDGDGAVQPGQGAGAAGRHQARRNTPGQSSHAQAGDVERRAEDKRVTNNK